MGFTRIGFVGAMLCLFATVPAHAVGSTTGPLIDSGKQAPRERSWSPYGKADDKARESTVEGWDEARTRCKRNHDTVCVRRIKDEALPPLRPDLAATGTHNRSSGLPQ